MVACRRSASLTTSSKAISIWCFGQQRIDPFGQDFQTLAPSQGRALVGDVGAGRAAFFDNSNRFQLTISAGDRIRIDHQLFGQGANRRQFLASRQPARRNQILDLIHDLLVDRNAVGG